MRRSMAMVLALVVAACSGAESRPSGSSSAVPATATTSAAPTTPVAATTTAAPTTTATPGAPELLAEAERLFDEGDLVEALAAIDRALAVDPDEPAALDLLGRTHEALGDLESAIGAFRRVLESDPGDQAVADRLGDALLDRLPAQLTGTEELVGVWPEGIAVTPGSLWVANSGSRSVTQLDADDLSTIGTVAVGRLPVDVTTTPDGTVWVVTRTDDTLWRIDPATGTATAEATLPDYASGLTHDPSGALHMATWVDGTSLDLFLASYDPASGVMSRSDPFGLQAGGSLEVADGKLWIASLREGLIVVDPATAAVEEILLPGRSVRDITVFDDEVFVAVGMAGSSDLDVFRISPDDAAPVFLAAVDHPETIAVSTVIVAVDGYVIAPGSDATVWFVVTDVPGFATSIATDLPSSGSLGSAVVVDGRLVYSAHLGDGEGVVVAIDLGSAG